MQNSVLFGMLITLLAKKIVTREEFAEKFEVSTRTVSRYIDVLNCAGVPIISQAGFKGGYYVPDDYKLDKLLFSAEEKARIIKCLAATASTFSDKLNSAISEKLAVVGRTAQSDNLLVKSDTLIIDAEAWTNPERYRNKISVLNSAIDSDYTISMKYIDRYEYATSRKFDPYSLILKDGIWYTYGFCHTRRDFRLFKLSRIIDIVLTSEIFIRRPSDVYAKLRRPLSPDNEILVTIEFTSLIRSDIEEWMGIESISERGNKLIAKANLFSGNALLAKLLSYGSSIQVLSPAFLKEELLVECRRTLKSYGYENDNDDDNND